MQIYVPHPRTPCWRETLHSRGAGCAKDTVEGMAAPSLVLHVGVDWCGAQFARKCRFWAACRGQCAASVQCCHSMAATRVCTCYDARDPGDASAYHVHCHYPTVRRQMPLCCRTGAKESRRDSKAQMSGFSTGFSKIARELTARKLTWHGSEATD